MTDDQARRAMADSLKVGDFAYDSATKYCIPIDCEAMLHLARTFIRSGKWTKLETKGGE